MADAQQLKTALSTARVPPKPWRLRRWRRRVTAATRFLPDEGSDGAGGTQPSDDCQVQDGGVAGRDDDVSRK
ncbi:hypothetical protein L1987_52965 [Smallanthus sonchifolius]|uniref:Uncharacterized protein n=1 Tax=Smallanthus sonchifolius TaxID=185202 RepID=A0ACB9EUW7_9ASTR|nr:hypothetical protein L1987_52965 [Smallanthus sonchifolius]